jgi:hypothetical protein
VCGTHTVSLSIFRHCDAPLVQKQSLQFVVLVPYYRRVKTPAKIQPSNSVIPAKAGIQFLAFFVIPTQVEIRSVLL